MSDRWIVKMGPIPNKPAWHQQIYANSSYAFPTKAAAERFARAHLERDPGREISVEGEIS